MVKDRLFIKLLEDVYYPKIFALKCQQTTFFFFHQKEWLVVPLLQRKQDHLRNASYSNHPSIFACFSWVGSHWQRAQKVILEALLPRNTSQLLLGDPEAFPGQMRYIIPPAGSGSAQGSPPSWPCQENIQREAPRRHPNQLPRTTSAGSFQRKEAAALLWAPSRCRAPHPISEAEPLIFFWSLPKAHEHGWALECRSTDKQKASPSSFCFTKILQLNPQTEGEPPLCSGRRHSIIYSLTETV